MDFSKYIGTRFSEHGRDLATGVDCYGLLLAVCRDRGIDLPDMDYEADWAANGKNLFVENYADYAIEIAEDCLMPGDAVLTIGTGGVANHVVIFIGAGLFIHAQRNVGVVRGRMNSKQFRRRIVGFYRIRGKA